MLSRFVSRRTVRVMAASIVLMALLLLEGDSDEPIEFISEDGFLVQYAGDAGTDIYEETFLLEEGAYHIKMDYTSSEFGNYLSVRKNDIEMEQVGIAAGEGTLEHRLCLEEPSPNVKILVHYAGTGYLEVKSLVIETESPWHNDNWIKGVLFVFGMGIILFLKRLSKSKKVPEKMSLEICIVFGIAVLSSSFLLSAQSVGHGDDLNYHLTRIEGIAQGLRDGQFPVMIYPDMLKENGYLNAAYPSLFLYIPAALRLMGVSYVVAYKLFLMLINLATAYAMYFSMRCMTKSGSATILATTMYVFARYRLNNMLVRGAVGETLAMIFLPLIVAGVYQIAFGDKKKWWIFVTGATGVIQSHVLSTAVYAVIAVALLLICARVMCGEKRYLSVCKAAGLTLLLNAGFLVPFAVFYVSGNLDLVQLTNFSQYRNESLNPAYLFGIFRIFQEDGWFIRDFALRLPLLCLLGIAILYRMRHHKAENRTDGFWRGLFVVSCILLFLSTNLFPYGKMGGMKFLDKFFSVLQFPWRFEGTAIGLLVMTGSVWLVSFDELAEYKKAVVIALTTMVLLDTSYWKLSWNESTTGEIVQRSADMDRTCADIISCPGEYMVKGSRQPEAVWTLSDEGTVIYEYQKDGTKIDAVYHSNGTRTRMDLPLMNYIGYTAEDEQGRTYDLFTGDAGNIQILLHPDGRHEIHLRYREPLLFRIAEFVSFFSLFVWVMMGITHKIKGMSAETDQGGWV